MNIDEVKAVADRILLKRKKTEEYNELLGFVDKFTETDGTIPVLVGGPRKVDGRREFIVDASKLRKLIEDEIAKQDPTADEAELKQKAK